MFLHVTSTLQLSSTVLTRVVPSAILTNQYSSQAGTVVDHVLKDRYDLSAESLVRVLGPGDVVLCALSAQRYKESSTAHLMQTKFNEKTLY